MLSADPPKEIRMAVNIGPKSPTDILHLSIGLACRDPHGLQSFVDSVSDPKSPNYRHFISPQEVGSRFGISNGSLSSVVSYLKGQGMKVRLVAKNRLSILADASVAQAQAAFRTTIAEFVQQDPFELIPPVRFSFTSPPSVPGSIGSLVKCVSGMESFLRPKPAVALTPDQLRTLYRVAPVFNGGYQGAGRTVAISNWDGYRLANIPIEYSEFGLPMPNGGYGSNVTVVSIDGQNGNAAQAKGEGDIDIQCVLAMSPLCNLIVYDNATQSDLLGVLTQEADDNAADIVTESYGWPAGYTYLYEQIHLIHQAMNAQGMTYLCASGDGGTMATSSYPYPIEDPEVLIVGGTSVATDSFGNRSSETGWSYSGGGWVVNSDPFNALPSYQQGTGIPTDIPFRLFPDVALDADPLTGYEIVSYGALVLGYGGTSCASPTMAGSLAACEQMILANGGLPADVHGNHRFGRIQDLLYSYNGNPQVFTDIVSGSNGVLPNGNVSLAGPGWDFVTGWGAPIFDGFVEQILGFGIPPELELSPPVAVGGTNVQGMIKLPGAAGAGGVTVRLSSSSPSAVVPPNVTIPAGANSATFSITTASTLSPLTASISATVNGETVTSMLTITALSLEGVSITPDITAGGNSLTGTVFLNAPSPIGGATVALVSSSSVVMVPSKVTVPQGLSTATFTVQTKQVDSSAYSIVTASEGAGNANTTVFVDPPSLSGLSFAPSTVEGQSTAIGTLTLNTRAPSKGITVLIKSNSSDATVPATVKIPGGANSATFSVTTKTVAADVTATITARDGITSFCEQTLVITPPTIQSLTVSPTIVLGGKMNPIATVSLDRVAPATGIICSLGVTNYSAGTVPNTVKIVGGAKSAKFKVTTLSVQSATTLGVQAGFGSVTKQANLIVEPPSIVSVKFKPASVKGSAKSVVTGTISIDTPAPLDGLTVMLASSNSNVVGVPTSVTFQPGKLLATFAVTHVGVTVKTQVTVTAILGGATTSGTLTVTP
jgi:subtilase family serine protease